MTSVILLSRDSALSRDEEGRGEILHNPKARKEEVKEGGSISSNYLSRRLIVAARWNDFESEYIAYYLKIYLNILIWLIEINWTIERLSNVLEE